MLLRAILILGLMAGSAVLGCPDLLVVQSAPLDPSDVLERCGEAVLPLRTFRFLLDINLYFFIQIEPSILCLELLFGQEKPMVISPSNSMRTDL